VCSIWNYLTHTLELLQSFAEVPFSVAFHPSGLHVAIGFADALRLCHVLLDSLQPYKEWPIKACREVQWSHGGQWLAAVDNQTVVRVFQTYTMQNVAEYV
jgi:hypothetical protein